MLTCMKCFQNMNQFKSIQKFSYSQLSKARDKLLFYRQNAKRNFGRTPRSSKLGQNKTIVERIDVENGPISSQNITKAIFFSFAFSTGSFIGVSIWEYEKMRSSFPEKKQSSNFSWLKSKLDRKQNRPKWQIELEKWWNKLTPGEQVFLPICAINTIVLCLWRVPKLQPFMMKYFCSNPAARVVCWPMVLSTFSHVSLFHIFANMFVLHSFSNIAVSSLGKEQFLGLYLSAGVLSTLSSYIYKAVASQHGLSLGASGAIMAILAYVCTAYPDTQLSILLLPMFTFSAGAAIKVVMAVDIAGCLLKWKIFDHAAHLGGALLGIFWYFNGRNNLWPQRHNFQKYWDKIRTSK